VAFLRRDEIDAEFAAGREFRGCIGLARDAPGSRCAAAAREIGQALQRVRRIAKMPTLSERINRRRLSRSVSVSSVVLGDRSCMRGVASPNLGL